MRLGAFLCVVVCAGLGSVAVTMAAADKLPQPAKISKADIAGKIFERPDMTETRAYLGVTLGITVLLTLM